MCKMHNRKSLYLKSVILLELQVVKGGFWRLLGGA